jgi:hypothetical protein
MVRPVILPEVWPGHQEIPAVTTALSAVIPFWIPSMVRSAMTAITLIPITVEMTAPYPGMRSAVHPDSGVLMQGLKKKEKART